MARGGRYEIRDGKRVLVSRTKSLDEQREEAEAKARSKAEKKADTKKADKSSKEG